MFHSGVHQWPGFGHKWPRVKSSCKMTRKHQWAAQCLSPKRDSNNSCKPKPEYYPLIYLIYELNSCIVLFASWIPHFKEAVHPQPDGWLRRPKRTKQSCLGTYFTWKVSVKMGNAHIITSVMDKTWSHHGAWNPMQVPRDSKMKKSSTTNQGFKRFKRVFINIWERDYTSIDIYIIDINCKHHLALQ